jgi:aminoglycoside 3-N-acetyltransferase
VPLFSRTGAGATGPNELADGLAELGLRRDDAVIVHASLSSFGRVRGGARAVAETLRGELGTVLTPAFTYYTMIWPAEQRRPDWPARVAPDTGQAFTPASPVSRDIGRVAQALVESPGATRTRHPVLSFVGHGERAAEFLAAQTLDRPYEPLGRLGAAGGWVLLIGVGHIVNSSIHHAEHLAGRPALTRYARLEGRIVGFPFPNCSAAFGEIEPALRDVRKARIGAAQARAVRVEEVARAVVDALTADPAALLCRHPGCRCQAVRRLVAERAVGVVG